MTFLKQSFFLFFLKIIKLYFSGIKSSSLKSFVFLLSCHILASGFPPVILESIGIFSYINLAIWDKKLFCKKRIVYTYADVAAGMTSGICFSFFFFYNGPYTGFTYPEMGQQQVQTSLYDTPQAIQLFRRPQASFRSPEGEETLRPPRLDLRSPGIISKHGGFRAPDRKFILEESSVLFCLLILLDGIFSPVQLLIPALNLPIDLSFLLVSLNSIRAMS